VIDQRMIRDAGADQRSLTPDAVQPASLAEVFGSDGFADRRIDEFDPYVSYIAVNTSRVPDLRHRTAIATALDRAQLRMILGGKYAGALADGVVKPSLSQDYARSGMWRGLLGKTIPGNGDPTYARKLLEQSRAAIEPLRYDYRKTLTSDKMAAALVASLGRVGIQVRPNGMQNDEFFEVALDPDSRGHLTEFAWGPDWPNASTVIPQLFTPRSCCNVSGVDDASFSELVEQARSETDRAVQGGLWQDLNRIAMQQVWVIPMVFGRTQRVAGSKVKTAAGAGGRVYLWSPYGSWPYADLYVDR
jgi:peptide/nickel transport system substrate-binding protein